MESKYFRENFCSFSSKSYYFYILGVSHLKFKCEGWMSDMTYLFLFFNDIIYLMVDEQVQVDVSLHLHFGSFQVHWPRCIWQRVTNGWRGCATWSDLGVERLAEVASSGYVDFLERCSQRSPWQPQPRYLQERLSSVEFWKYTIKWLYLTNYQPRCFWKLQTFNTLRLKLNYLHFEEDISNIFFDRKLLYFNSSFTEICHSGLNWR